MQLSCAVTYAIVSTACCLLRHLRLFSTEDCHLPKVMTHPKLLVWKLFIKKLNNLKGNSFRLSEISVSNHPWKHHILWDWNANTNVHVLTKFAGQSCIEVELQTLTFVCSWSSQVQVDVQNFMATSTQKSWKRAFFLKAMHGRITKLQVEVLSVFNAQSCAEKLHRRTLRFKRWVYIDQSCVQKAFWSVSAWKGDIF